MALGPAPANFVVTEPMASIQDDRSPGGKQSGTPSGGTPEPTTLLLLAGGALGYGAVRMMRKRGASQNSADPR